MGRDPENAVLRFRDGRPETGIPVKKAESGNPGAENERAASSPPIFSLYWGASNVQAKSKNLRETRRCGPPNWI